MNNRQILEDVYRDFFPEREKVVEEETVEIEEEPNIDSLFISDESRALLNKIIKYMEDYSKKEETNYLPFHLTIETKDNNTITDLTNIVKYYANKYNYVDNKNSINLSLYKLDYKCFFL